PSSPAPFRHPAAPVPWKCCEGRWAASPLSSWRHAISLLSATSAKCAVSRDDGHEDAGDLELDALDLSFRRHPVRGGGHYLDEAVARLRRDVAIGRRVRLLHLLGGGRHSGAPPA